MPLFPARLIQNIATMVYGLLSMVYKQSHNSTIKHFNNYTIPQSPNNLLPEHLFMNHIAIYIKMLKLKDWFIIFPYYTAF